MNVPIWPGSSSFSPGNTPFGFYDNETDFQTDIDKFSVFASRRLGYPFVEIGFQGGGGDGGGGGGGSR